MKLFNRRKTAQDRIIEDIQSRAADYVTERFDKTCSPADKIESPIEVIFMASLMSLVKFGAYEFENLTYDAMPGDNRFTEKTVFVEMQARVIDWPVDFAIRIKDPFSAKVKTVVVECDGHDYHERTKEQAARDRSRDRALQSLGHTIFRFTGSELWNKPIECADQVLEALSSAYVDYLFDHYKISP